MIQIRPFSDKRLEGFCIYCGKMPDSRDHVPSKILLDQPFPKHLPVVASCKKCNEKFSLDEEYFACILECLVCGTTEIEELQREKIKSILYRKPKLHSRIIQSFIETDKQTYFKIETERFKDVILKLAKGHAKYENSEIQFQNPTEIWIKAINTMTNEEADEFFSESLPVILPEIGSRSFQRLFIDFNNVVSNWIEVQSGNYRYSFGCENGITIKILVREYLAAKIVWN